jgi:hypothetical protein
LGIRKGKEDTTRTLQTLGGVMTKTMKIIKCWNKYCGHYIFFLENEEGVFVYYTYDKTGLSSRPSERTRTGWRRCDFTGFGGWEGEQESSKLEFLLLTGHSIDATIERDIG